MKETINNKKNTDMFFTPPSSLNNPQEVVVRVDNTYYIWQCEGGIKEIGKEK